MKLTNEQIKKAKMAKCIDELINLSKENNIDLTMEEAKKYFDSFHNDGSLSDDELINVSGGSCDGCCENEKLKQKYDIGDYVEVTLSEYGCHRGRIVELRPAAGHYHYVVEFDNPREFPKGFPPKLRLCLENACDSVSCLVMKVVRL